MNYPIRILCVFSTLDRGGAESMCMNIYRHIDREKVQFDFVKHTPNKGAFENEIIELGGKIYEAPEYKMYNHISYCKWWKHHLIEHPEHIIVHGHYFTISYEYLKVAKHYGRITIAHSHAKHLDSFLKNQLIKGVPKVSDYRFACSYDAGVWLFKDYTFMILKNAIDTNLYRFNQLIRDSYRSQLKLDDKFVLGTVANFHFVKNPFGMIDLFKRVHQKNENAVLVWVGEGGLRDDIQKKIEEERLQECIYLLGSRDDVPQLLQAMDAFALPSFSEGLGLVLIEAQAAGLPTYCADTIPTDVDITPLCKHLPLDQLDTWANQIISDYKGARENTENLIMEQGYDIRDTSKWVQEFYLKLFNNKNQ